MSAKYEQIVLRDDESFFIGIFQDNLEKSTWHYHNNFEISFITEGMGKRIVADSIEEFQPGDLVFIGSNLPHVWMAEREHSLLSERALEMVFLQFSAKYIQARFSSAILFYLLDYCNCINSYISRGCSWYIG